MLRTIFVTLIIAFGIIYAVQGSFYFLLFYLWYAYFRPDAWIYWLNWVQSLNLSLVLGVGVLISTALSVPKFRFNITAGLMLLFLIHTIVSTIASAHPDASWDAWWMFVRVWLISYAIILLVTDVHRFRLTILVIALSLGFEGAKQGWAGLILNPGGSNTNSLPFLGDNNGVAVGMMMLVPLFSALAQTTTRRWERILYGMFGVGVFLRGLTTYSRGGFLAALVLAAFYWMQSRHKFRALVSIALVASLVLAVMPQQFWDRMHTITAPAEQRDDSERGRLYFWKVGADMAFANPFVGVGFGAYNESFTDYDKENFGGVRATHSTWFGVLAETGFIGFGLLVALYLTTLYHLLSAKRASRRNDAASDVGAYSGALFTSLVTFGAGGSFVSLQYNEMFWHFIALGVALRFMAASLPQRARVEEPTQTAPMRSRASVA